MTRRHAILLTVFCLLFALACTAGHWQALMARLIIPFIVAWILMVLGCPLAILKKSWWWLIPGMALSLLIVVLPLFFFFVSSLMQPDWKGNCPHGWLDCFIVGKLALTPFVLWATIALYKVEILRADGSKERWVVLGIFLGAVVAIICLIFGLVCYHQGDWILLSVPVYVAVWYALRAWQLIRAADFGFLNYFLALLGTLPFWLCSWIWSSGLYQSLPDTQPPDCFVVMAAGRGHRKLVGPFFEIERRGRRRPANQQLITLWQFESLWSGKFPLSHRLFRHGYNCVGPQVASLIRSPWLADVAFIVLKPVEFIARHINQQAKEHL